MEGEELRRLESCYKLLGVLGTGGFSVVHSALSKEDGTKVAVKTLKKQGGAASVSNTLVENEIMVMNRIVEYVSPHPNVIHLVDVFEDPDCVHLVLELCEGGELFDRIVQQERYSEAGASRVIRQITNGLASLHMASISHRDLKPENCLFLTPEEDSPLKIMDFGLSHIEGLTNPVVGLFGSIDYVSPEALSKRSANSAGDMWALGVILYILLCGYPPFHATNNKDKQQLIMSGSFDFDDHSWKAVSTSAKQLIASLLTVDPTRRPSSAELLLHPWVTGHSARSEPMEPEVFQRLVSFNARRKFRAAAYASIVSNQFMMRTKRLQRILGGVENLSQEELNLLHTNFKRISSNGTSVNMEEFEQVLRSMSMGSLVPLAQRIFEHFDCDKNGRVDMREIVCGFSSLRNRAGEEPLKLCFKMYDADGSGFISRDELACMLKALPEAYLPEDLLSDPGKFDELFDRMDANCDGRLSYEEFKEAIETDGYLLDAILEPARSSLSNTPLYL